MVCTFAYALGRRGSDSLLSHSGDVGWPLDCNLRLEYDVPRKTFTTHYINRVGLPLSHATKRAEAQHN